MFLQSKQRFLVVIPAFNEGIFIYNVVRGAKKVVNDIVVIDDGSEDETADEARRAGAVVLTHSKNKGKGFALRTGFDYALRYNFDAVITVDGDGQHTGSDVAKLISIAQSNNADLAIGVREMTLLQMPFVRLAANVASSVLVSFLVRRKLSDVHSGARFIGTEILRAIKLTSANFDIEVELIIKAIRHGFRIVQVKIQTIYGSEKSDIKPFLDVVRYFRVLYKELKIAS